MAKRKIVVIDEDKCNGCGECIVSCAEKALQIVNGKARLVKDSYCDGLGACLGKCPMDAIRIEEREADAYDHAAVSAHIAPPPKACGCPSVRVMSFDKKTTGSALMQCGACESQLRQWPVQLNLVPATAPFLRDCDLLIAADCVPIAYGDFHNDLLRGRTVVIGCPKFDDVEAYHAKLVAIFRAGGVKSVAVAVMEVPCCAVLQRVVEEALAESGAKIDYKRVVIGIKGDKLS